MKLKNLFNIQDLYNEINNGNVSVREYHNKIILNYTSRITYSGNWNKINTQTRGLIVEAPLSGESNIIARPFAKFFTLDQEQGSYHLCDEEGSFESTFVPDFSAQIIATDKLDGSLGILWNDNGEPALSTRGCLDSEIALFFTNFLRSNSQMYKYAKHMIECFPHKTFLFELLEPDEHVIHYDKEDIVFLGCVDIETGNWKEACLLDSEWEHCGLRIAERLNCNTLAEALELPERENAEGMVIHFADGKLIKFKQESYLIARQIHYNWKKEFMEQLEKTTFAQWDDYANGIGFDFRNMFIEYEQQMKSIIKLYSFDVFYLEYLWNEIFSNFEGTQKQYAFMVLEYYSEYKKFLFDARKYNGIKNLHPFDYIERN